MQDGDVARMALGRAAARDLLDPDDQRALEQLDEARRELGYRRLAVLADRKERRAFATTDEAAEYAGFAGRNGVYALIHRMKRPSLEGLGLELRKRGGQPAKAPARAVATTIAEEALRADPRARTGALLHAMAAALDEAGQTLSQPTLVSIMDEARRGVAVTAPFGRMALDSGALDLRDAAGGRCRLFGLVEINTGLVLGWDVAGPEGFGRGYASAVRMAEEQAAVGTFDGLAVALERPWLTMRWFTQRYEVPFRGTFEYEGRVAAVRADRLLGRDIVAVLGRNLGGIRIGTGLADDLRHGVNSSKAVELPIVGDRHLVVIGEALAAHNGRRLSIAVRGPGRPSVRHAVCYARAVLRGAKIVMPPDLADDAGGAEGPSS